MQDKVHCGFLTRSTISPPRLKLDRVVLRSCWSLVRLVSNVVHAVLPLCARFCPNNRDRYARSLISGDVINKKSSHAEIADAYQLFNATCYTVDSTWASSSLEQFVSTIYAQLLIWIWHCASCGQTLKGSPNPRECVNWHHFFISVENVWLYTKHLFYTKHSYEYNQVKNAQ